MLDLNWRLRQTHNIIPSYEVKKNKNFSPFFLFWGTLFFLEKRRLIKLKRTIFVVGLIALIGAIMVMPAAATTEEFFSDKDTYIDECEPDENCDDVHVTLL